MATKEEIERVKEIDLVDLVMDSDIPYKREHGHIKIRCIFHNERTPSLTIWPDHFYCFGCSEHGDVISWAEQAFEVSFSGAIDILIKYIKEKHEKNN